MLFSTANEFYHSLPENLRDIYSTLCKKIYKLYDKARLEVIEKMWGFFLEFGQADPLKTLHQSYDSLLNHVMNTIFYGTCLIM